MPPTLHLAVRRSEAFAFIVNLLLQRVWLRMDAPWQVPTKDLAELNVRGTSHPSHAEPGDDANACSM